MQPAMGYPIPPVGYPPYGYPSSEPKSTTSSEIVKPARSSKIVIADPKSGKEVNILDDKSSNETASTTEATTTSTTTTPVTISTTTETTETATTTATTEPIVEEAPKQTEEATPVEEKQTELETPQTPISEYTETPTTLEGEETFDNSKSSDIDEDKVIKEDPSEIDGMEDSSEEEEEEGETEPSSKVYSRDYLLKFRDVCTEAPEKLKGMGEIFLISKGASSSMAMAGGFNKGGQGRGGGRGGGQGGRGGTTRGGASSRGGRGGFENNRGGARGGKGATNRKQGSYEKLSKSQNALKLSKDKPEDEVIVDEVKFILNRLTPENYERLKIEFLNACIKKPGDEAVLNGIIDQIFIFAINLQNFSALYAKLCADLSNELKERIGEENTKQFKRLLLNKCQKEFENEKKEELEKAAQVGLSPEEVEEKEFLLRKKKVGNMIFIGELYLQDMLSEKIMHEVIKRLLVNPTPYPSSDDIELLCRLLTTIGSKLDHEKSKKYVNYYFGKMETLAQDKDNLASRLRFMLRDVIDMRINNWVARIEKTKATKTRQEARDDAVKQQMDQIKKIEKHHHNRKTTVKTKTVYNNNNNNNNKQSGLQAERYRKMDAKKTLAPGGGNLITKAPSPTQSKKDLNSFSLLEDEEEKEPVSEEEEEEVIEEVEVVPEETEEQIKETTEKTKRIINNFFEEGEIEDTIETITKENLFKSHHFAKTLALCACENSRDAELSDCVKLCKRLTQGAEPLVTETVFVDGLISYLLSSVQEETYVDIPELFPYTGKLFGRLLFEKVLPFNCLYDILVTVVLDEDAPLQEEHAFDILKNVFASIKSECELNDDLKKILANYEDELENHLVLSEVEAGKHLVNSVMDIMNVLKPNGDYYSKFCELVEENCYGCFEPSVFFNKKINEKEEVDDYINLLSIEQIISGILNSSLHEDPVQNVESFQALLKDQVKEKLEDGDEITILGISQYACFIRNKFESIKPLLTQLVDMGLLTPKHYEQYKSGELAEEIDQPGYDEVKGFL